MTSRLVALALGALAAAVSLLGCDSLPGKPAGADRPLNSSQIVDFAPLYASNCAGCHGANGALGAGPLLASPVYLALVSDDDLRAVISNGVPSTPMPAFALQKGGTLSDDQIDVIVAGLRKRFADPAKVAGLSLPPYRAGAAGAAAGDPAGAAAYGRYCGACHGADGAGGPGGGSVVDSSYLALVSDQGLRTAVVVGRPDLGMPDWRGVPGGPMSPQDVSAVVAWMAAKRVKYPGVESPAARGG